MKNIKGIVKEIVKYESEFNGGLIFSYKSNIEEFKNDLVNEIHKNGAVEILEYYKTYLNSCNDTNSTERKRKELRDLVLILEGFVY